MNAKKEELKELSNYVDGLADGAASTNPRMACKLRAVKDWLDQASWSVCSQGFLGCRSDNCTSDHK